MRSLWILPDRNQSGNLQIIEGGEIKLIGKALELSKLPRSLVLGIPEELLKREAENSQFVFTQYARSIRSSIFCLSIRCGLDKTGRTETLTNIQILEPGEQPKLPPLFFESTDKEIIDHLSKLNTLLDSPSNNIRKKIEQMMEAVKNLPSKKTFSSDHLQHSANKPDWMPPGNPSTHLNFFLISVAALLITLLCWIASLP